MYRLSFNLYAYNIIDMKNFKLVIIALLLILNTLQFQIEQQQSNTLFDNLGVFIKRLFELQNLEPSAQLDNCLNQQTYSNKIAQIIKQFAHNGSISSSSVLPKSLSSAISKLNSSVPNSIMSCIYGSNDFQILLRRFNITKDNIISQFQSFSKANFLAVHYIFTNMSTVINDAKLNQTQKYAKLAQLTNDLALTVYLKNGVMADDPWKIRIENVQSLSQYFGVSVSNGVLGVVSSRNPLRLDSTVLAGAYDKVGRGRVDNLVQTFPALKMQMYFNGNSRYYNYVQQLNMRQGSMSHSLSTSQMSLEYNYYALQNLPNVFYTKFTVTAHQDGQLTSKSVQEAPEGLIDMQKYHEDIDTSVGIFKLMSSEAKTKTGKLTLVVSTSIQFEGTNPPQILHQDWDSNLHLQKFRKKLKKGDQFSFVVITSLMSSQNHEDPINQAIRLVLRASSMSNILVGHAKKWDSLWESDIVIEGNDVDQKYVRSMLYHCYSFISPYKSYGLSPMGLSGLGYNGHVFWDMDLWIYPAILALKPSLARSLINYRYQRLETAKQNAFLNGYKGAMYPWQSSKSGNEQTPVWALSGPLQHHISGCVSFGAWNYYLVTQDKQWLIEKGYPIISQVAQFFQSRVQLGQDGFYHIKNVVGADQWAENIDDDAFTNGIAKISLQIANKASKILNLPNNSKWDDISQKIIILKMQNGVTKEHATYKGENIKQADANLLSYPLNIVNKTQDILKDLQYYEVRVPDSGTPAMTYSIFTLLYSKLKNQTMAYKNFKQSFLPFLRKPFGVFAQTKGGSNPYFLTGAGGVLQSVIFGFGGFNIGDQGIYLTNNTIPASWKKVTIKSEANIKTTLKIKNKFKQQIME